MTVSSLDVHQAAYTKAFAHYEENHLVHVAYGLRVANRLRELRARAVLSLGIGHTEVARPILEMLREGALGRYVLVDAAPAIIQGFAESITPAPPGLELIEAYFESFVDSERFDAIEAGFVLEHVDDPALLLRHLRGLLREDGRLFVAVPNARSLHRVLGHEAGLLPDLYALSPADLELGHRRYFDLERLVKLVGECGWSVQSRAGLMLKPFTTRQMEQLALPAEVWRALQQVAEGYPEISNSFCLELSLA